MNNSFLSLIYVVHQHDDRQQLGAVLANCYPVLLENFAHYEVILVNNVPEWDLKAHCQTLPEELRRNIYILQLANRTNRNHAILAGLDRANGDYTVIMEAAFADAPQLLVDLYGQSQQGFDIVYLRGPGRHSTWAKRWLYSAFHYIMRRYSRLMVDERAHNTRIISRRALNSLLRLRENMRYMKAIYALVGYRSTYLDTAVPLPDDEPLGERFRTSLVAITSFTTFLRSLMLWIFLGTLAFLFAVVANALKVKFTQTDLLGNAAVANTGWTFLVLLIAVFFAVTCLNLYIMSVYLSNIYTELKQRPPYIIEAVQRV